MPRSLRLGLASFLVTVLLLAGQATLEPWQGGAGTVDRTLITA